MAAAIAGCQGVFHVATLVPSGNSGVARKKFRWDKL
jgi:hypothetical protein